MLSHSARRARIGGLHALTSLAALSAALVPASAVAQVALHPEVVRAQASALAADGPEGYAAVRELWRAWDRADPTEVEEGLLAVAGGAKSAPLRIYADLLAAYARRRRGDLDGALDGVRKLGYASSFAIAGPFDNAAREGLATVFGPEEGLVREGERAAPFSGASPSYLGGKGKSVSWRVPPSTPGFGWVDLGDFLRPREKVCGFATTLVKRTDQSTGKKPVSLWVGAAGAVRVYWDDELVIEDEAYRQLDADRVAAHVAMTREAHRVTVKICADRESPKFTLRVGKPDGSVEPAVMFTLEPPKSAMALPPLEAPRNPVAAKPRGSGNDAVLVLGPAPKSSKSAKGSKKPAAPDANGDDAAFAKPKLKKTARPAGGALGPLQIFEERAGGGARAAEAYARYLVTTGGEAQGRHDARDLASRAAESEPTVARLLLAAQLAEDPNQRRTWVEKARALAGRRSTDEQLMLAEAALVRAGVHGRAAALSYQRILATHPDSVPATLGLADLYAEAGLKRSGLALLERAAARQPHAVALLRTLASELRGAGRDVEADEMEARYASLRFDDSGYLSDRIELATRRRDHASADRWVERLLRTETDATWALGMAAKAQRAMGRKGQALASYRRALELAPEDAAVLRAMSDVHGMSGERDEQLRLLRRVLEVTPEAKDVREYVEHIAPPKARFDEAYAWPADRFAKAARAPIGEVGRNEKRTLRNLTVSTVYENGLASRFRQVVFQPVTDAAAAANRQYGFVYEHGKQTVTIRAAKVYRRSGRVDEAIESGEVPMSDPTLNMYTSQRSYVISLPRLEPGDVVEVRYRVDDVVPEPELGSYFGEVEYLQSAEPTQGAEFVLVRPKKLQIHVAASRLPGVKRSSSEAGAYKIDRFELPKIDGVTAEPNMPPPTEVFGRVHVSTFGSWDALGRWYWGLVKDRFDVDDEVRKTTQLIAKGLVTEREKVAAVNKYVAKLRYVALEFGIEGIRPRRAAQTLSRGWGDCKDKATLLVTMLRELGIPASLVVLRTRLRGGFDEQPASLAPFDHAIAYVPSLDLYLDGTAENTGLGELPAMDRGALGFVVDEKQTRLVRLPEPGADQSPIRRAVEISPDAKGGAAPFELSIDAGGVFAPELRQRYGGAPRERVARDLASLLGPVDLAAGDAGASTSNLEDLEKPVAVRAKGKARAFGRRDDDRLSVPVAPSLRLVAEFAPQASRTQDLVLPAKTLREETWTVHVPQGMRADVKPQAASLTTPFAAFKLDVTEAGDAVVVKSSLRIDKTRITPAEYGAFRSFCAAVERAFGQRLVLAR